MTVNFLAPARPGPIAGEADVTQLGKTVAFVEGRLMAADGTVLATATSSARLVETAKAIQSASVSSRLRPAPKAHRAGICTIGGLALSASTWKPATRL